MKKLFCLVLAMLFVLSAVTAIAETEKTWTDEWVIDVPATGLPYDSSRDTLVGEELYRRFGIEFRYVDFVGDWEENIALWLATGNYPEVVHITNPTLASDYISAGVLLNLEPYLDDMPNFTARFAETIPYWRAFGDGTMYFWQAYVQRKLASDMMFEVVDIAVRTDLLEKAGWPTLVSCTDWINFLETYVPDAVDVFGEPIEGMTFNGGDTWGLEGAVPIMYEKSADYVAISNASYSFNFTEDKFDDYFKNRYVKEGFEFFNNLYKCDLLHPDSWTMGMGDCWEVMKTGSVAACWYINDTMLTGINKALVDGGHPEMSYIVMPIMSDSMVAEGQKRSIRYETNRPGDNMALTIKCKDPERYLAMIDWLSSDEGSIMFRSGFEGVHWNYVDGVRTATDELLACITDANKSNEIFLSYRNLLYFNEPAADGLPHDLRLTMENYSIHAYNDRQKEAYDKLGWGGNSMGWYTEHSFLQSIGTTGAVAIRPEDTDMAALNTQMTEFRSRRTYELITADDFNKAYDAAMVEYDKLGGEKLIQYLNDQYIANGNVLETYAYVPTK